MTRLNIKTIVQLIIIGIIAGITGIVLTWFLHIIQQYAFGTGSYSDSSFREIVEYASPVRRLTVLMTCGAIVGIGWVYIHRYCPKLVSIKTAVDDPKQHMPFITTICHSLLQILTIGLGSPLGREAAPREISTAFAAKLIQLFHTDEHTGRLLLSCAAGAGLAAVYNIPIAATIFTLETLIHDWSFKSVSAAMLCCGMAVYIMRLGLGDLVQYPLPQVDFNGSLVIWAAIAGPVIAISVFLFKESLKPFPVFSRKSPKMIIISVLAFTIIGALSMWHPEILGNGKAGNQLSFTNAIDWQYGLSLFAAKWLAVILATAAGAYGGHITPSMMLGGMIGLTFAAIWNGIFLVIPVGMAAFIGATVYLGLAQEMPITAAIFLIEMSRFSPAYLFPICICFATAMPIFIYLQEKAT